MSREITTFAVLPSSFFPMRSLQSRLLVLNIYSSYQIPYISINITERYCFFTLFLQQFWTWFFVKLMRWKKCTFIYLFLKLLSRLRVVIYCEKKTVETNRTVLCTSSGIKISDCCFLHLINIFICSTSTFLFCFPFSILLSYL